MDGDKNCIFQTKAVKLFQHMNVYTLNHKANIGVPAAVTEVGTAKLSRTEFMVEEIARPHK